jgi:sugar (pentulose or hexulose) kinase
VSRPDVRPPRTLGLAAGALLASSATLLCCVLPAVLVAIGAGAALAGLVAAIPQLVWLSEHKPLVFGAASCLLVISGIALWRARRVPCPTDPALARSCARLRRLSVSVYAVALACFTLGAVFAFLLPVLVP